jgi:hypothetical protein
MNVRNEWLQRSLQFCLLNGIQLGRCQHGEYQSVPPQLYPLIFCI